MKCQDDPRARAMRLYAERYAGWQRQRARMIAHGMGCPEVAGDLIGEVWLRLFDHRDRWRTWLAATDDRRRAILAAITRRALHEMRRGRWEAGSHGEGWRRLRPLSRAVPSPDDIEPVDPVLSPGHRWLLRRALETMPADLAQLIHARRILGLDHAASAALFGRSVRGRCARLSRRLEATLAPLATALPAEPRVPGARETGEGSAPSRRTMQLARQRWRTTLESLPVPEPPALPRVIFRPLPAAPSIAAWRAAIGPLPQRFAAATPPPRASGPRGADGWSPRAETRVCMALARWATAWLDRRPDLARLWHLTMMGRSPSTALDPPTAAIAAGWWHQTCAWLEIHVGRCRPDDWLAPPR